MINSENELLLFLKGLDLFKSAPFGAALHQMLYDEEGKAINYSFLRINSAFERITKLKASEIEGKTVLEAIPKIDREMIDLYNGIVKNHESKRYLQFSNTLGKYLDIKAFFLAGDYFISIVDDVTDHTLKDIALKESEETFRALHENMTQGVVYQNTKGEIISANPSASNILGLTLDQMQGRTSIDSRWKAIREDGSIFPGEEHPAMVSLKTGETVRNIIMGVYHPSDDKTVWININSVPLFRKGAAEPYQVFTTFDDISTQKAAQKALIQSEKDKELAIQDSKVKSSFLANMSHEIRTPLNGIVGMIDLMSQAENLTDLQKENINIVKQSSMVLLKVLNDILDLSKLQAGKFQLDSSSNNIHDLIDQVKNLFSAQLINKKLTYTSSHSSDLNKNVLLDSTKFIQILSNLVGNAIKFTNEGGIHLTSSLLEENEEHLILKIEVQDTGEGIGKSDQENIFTEFKQVNEELNRNHKGTGLGLAICKKMVELHGGEIGVNSIVGEGSSFWFTIKVLHSNETTIPDKTKDSTPTLQESASSSFDLKVLVVDDNEVNIKVADLMLQKLGCKVFSANNGFEAIELYKNHSFDLILMDVQMPIMDGVEATQILRENHKKLPPIIGLSANALAGDAQKFIDLGMDDYLAKPITSEILFKKLKKWF